MKKDLLSMKNRISFELAPINTGFAPNGIYDDRIFHFHESRSGNLITSSYVGNIATSKYSVTNASTAFFCSENVSKLTKLAKLISGRGSIPAIQIGSRISAQAPQREWTGNLSNHVEFSSLELTRLSTYEIQKEIDLLVNIATQLADCGYSIVQLHAAHGYFLSRLFNRVINKRIDKFAFGRLEWISDALSKFYQSSSQSLLELRLNIRDGIEASDKEISYKKLLMRAIIGVGFKRLSLSNGFYDINKQFIYPTEKNFSVESFLFASDIATEHQQCTISVAGNMFSCITKDTNMPTNLVIALGRPLIANPFAVTNFWNNRPLICNFCGDCHYFSKGLSSLNCPHFN